MRVGEQRDVLAAFAQRRHAQLDHVQAVVEVLAELARLDQRGEVLVGGADDAHVDRILLAVAPTLRTCFSWIARSSFTCIGSGRSATSSRNSVPPLRGLEEAVAVLARRR